MVKSAKPNSPATSTILSPEIAKARRKDVRNLRQIEKDCFTGHRSRFTFYAYLAAVYKLYRRWKKENKAKTRMKQLVIVSAIKLRKDTHPIRAIIDASSKADQKTKSEWTSALR